MATRRLAMPTINTFAPRAASIPSESPGELPVNVTCWVPSHPQHVWPTAPGSSFRIEDCEFHCFYCYKGGQYTGKYFSKPKDLRDHVVQAHLGSGGFTDVRLLGTHRHDSITRKRKDKRLLLPDSSLDLQLQLSRLASILWLKPEHHAHLQRLLTIYFTGRAKSLDNAVALFLYQYGARLWPEPMDSRRHLSMPQDASLSAYFGTVSGPSFGQHGKMSWKKQDKYRRDHAGKDPSVSESIGKSPLGRIVARYGVVLKEMGELNGEDTSGYAERERLIEKICGAQSEAMSLRNTTDSMSHDAGRESSPDVPLKEASKKRARAEEDKEKESSPDVPLMTVRKKPKVMVRDEQKDSSPEAPLKSVSRTNRRSMLGVHCTTAEIPRRNAMHSDVSTIATIGTGMADPMNGDNANDDQTAASNQPAPLPLWEAFLSDALSDRSGTGIGDVADLRAAIVESPTDTLVDVLQELQTSFQSTGGISPKSIGIPAAEQVLSGPTINHSLPQQDFDGRRRLVDQHMPTNWASQVQPPAHSFRTTFEPFFAPPQARNGRHSVPYPGAGISDSLQRDIAASSLSRLPNPLVQHQPLQQFSNAGAGRRDSDLQMPAAQPEPTSYALFPVPASTTPHILMDYAPPQAPATTTILSLPRAESFERAAVANRMRVRQAFSGVPSLGQDKDAIHRAKMEMYRRETGGMCGLPVVLP